MVKGRRIILLSLLITLFLFSVVYGETLKDTDIVQNTNQIQAIEGFSEPRYTIFGGRDDVHTILSEEKIEITPEEIENAEEANDYGALKGKIHEKMKNYEETFIINYKVATDGETLKNQISSIWNKIFDDDYYLYGTMSVYNSYAYIIRGNDVIIKFYGFKYHTTRKQENFVDKEIERIAKEIIKDDMSDFEKVKAVNDWVVNKTKYNVDTEEKYNGASPHAAYTLLTHGEGVCQAYALVVNRLLDEAKLKSIYVTGTADDGSGEVAHAWNLVEVDGKWYHLDTTWNDPVAYKDMLSYGYFLKTDAAISTDHAKDNRIDYPKATDNKYKDMWNMNDSYEYNNSIYYSNHSNENYNIYRFDLNNLKNTLFLEDVKAPYTAGYDDWIYFSNYSANGHIYKVKIDGTGLEKLEDIKNPKHSINLYIEFPYLNYFEIQEIYEDGTFDGVWKYIKIADSIDVENISLNRTQDIVLTKGGESVKLIATVQPQNATNKNVVWSSNDMNVATVTQTGEIIPISKGTATITVKSKNGSAITSVKVIVKDGYTILPLNKKEDNTRHSWTISLNQEVDEATVNYDYIYIENEFGDRLDGSNFNVDLVEPSKVVLSIVKGEYEKGKVYYVVVEKGLQSAGRDPLKEPVKLPFIIK